MARSSSSSSSSSSVPTIKIGGEWEVPEGSVVTTPSGASHTVTGGVYVITETGTHSNDTGDRITGRDR